MDFKMVDKKNLEKALSNVKYPGFNKDVVSLGLIKEIKIGEGNVQIIFSVKNADPEVKQALNEATIKELSVVPGIKKINVEFEPDSKKETKEKTGLPPKKKIPGISHIIPVASGKGGVGKSTVAVNLAAALSQKGLKVGLLDLDIYGPSIPLMMGVQEMPKVTPDNKIHPLEKFGMRLMSIGFLVEKDAALIWRGPMVMKAVDQFLFDVEWGQLDYLIIDLPPGTGDAQLTLVQSVPITASVVVTTPQDVALLDAKKAVIMFEQTNTPVLGIVENMSYFHCPNCDERSEIFGHGGGKNYSDQLNVPFLGEIPLHTGVRVGGDEGMPIVFSEDTAEVKLAFTSIVDNVIRKIEIEKFARLEE